MKHNYQPDVWRLLRRNISTGQLLGYGVANVVGLAVILIGVLFYCDSQHSRDAEDQFFSNDYVVLSKRVEGIGFSPATFSPEDIDTLSRQPWARQIGRFTASQFAVRGEVAMGGKVLSTYLFFESVPDDFFDIKPERWSFKPGDRFVPIILCKDYLTLYNYGFAIPQGLPQVSEKFIGDIPLTLCLTGEDMQGETFEAAVVGFSSRLNTIAVPQSFMDWANARYSRTQPENPSRVIVKTDRLASAGMPAYLARHGLEVAGDKEEAGNISSFLGIVSAVVTTNGFVICALAIFVLVLSIFLLLQKSREKLRNLMLLGYHPLAVARYYQRIVVWANILITLLSTLTALLSRSFWSAGLESIGLGGASVLPMLGCSAAYITLITLFDIAVIRRQLLRIWAGA